jgi:hypothetical protein
MSGLGDVFQKKYTEFCTALSETCPELKRKIDAAKALSPSERVVRFKTEILPTASPSRDAEACPGTVLPGVTLSPSLWTDLSIGSQKAIQEYLTLLSFSLLMQENSAAGAGAGAAGAAGAADADPMGPFAAKFMEDIKAKMNTIDFSKLSGKIAEMFTSTGAAGAGAGPQLPEKFLKGKIAKLAEEMIQDIRVEDFGIDPLEFEAGKSNPERAIELMTNAFQRNPELFQGAIAKLTKKLQQKVQSGALNPKELVAEAEELMKTFSDNAQFVGIMESFRQAFGFEDTESARAVGRDGENRLSIVQQRLRKKLEERKAARGGGGKGRK